MTLEDAEHLEQLAREALGVLSERGPRNAQLLARRAADHASALVRLVQSRDRAEAADVDFVGGLVERLRVGAAAYGPRVATMLADLHLSPHAPWELTASDLERVRSYLPNEEGYATLRQRLEAT